MTTAEVVQFGIVVSMALVAAVLAIGAVATLSDLSRRLGYSFLPYVFPMIGLVMAWGPLTSQRNLGAVSPFFDASLEEIGTARWVSRLLVALALAISAERILTRLFSGRRAAPPGLPLFVALLAVLLTHYVLGAFLGEKPSFSLYYIYPFFLFSAAYAAGGADVERSIRLAKVTLFVFLLAGVGVAAIRPDIVVQSGYRGLFPGVSFRYWGLGAHANSLAPLALLCLLCIAHQPFRRPILQWTAVAVALGSLVLAQSKTMWVAAVVAFSLLGLARLWPQIVENWRAGRLTLGVSAVVAVTMLSIVGVGILLALPATEQALTRATEFAYGAHLTTFTGRDRVWAVALEDWRRNPLFGYGPSWGDAEYRLAVGIPSAIHAHNQLVHSAASAGTLGFIASVAYLIALVTYAARSFRRSKGFSAALVSVIVVQGVTEVPLLLRGFGTTGMFYELFTFVILIAYAERRSPEVVARPVSRSPGQAWQP